MSNDINAVGLDIGTSKVRCVIGSPIDDGRMSVIGIGEAESKGLRRGVVTSTEAVAEAIERSIAEAERRSGVEVGSATVNLSGEHLQGENRSGVVAVAGQDREITLDDVERAIDSAGAMPLTPGWEVVSRLPQEFVIDGQDGITEPVGVQGSRLEALVHVVSSPSAGKQNLMKALSRSQVDVEELVPEPLAAAASVLSDDDKEYGCAVVNMGSEVTSMVVFSRGAVRQTVFFPFGSMLFTKDIATGLRVSIPEANNIKHNFGCVASHLLGDDERREMIEIEPFGREEKRALSKEILTDILQPRAVELLQHVAEAAHASGTQFSAGVFLTGGGAAIRGMAEIAEQVFDAPTRIGMPDAARFDGLLNEVRQPHWSVACGLAYWSMRTQLREGNAGNRFSVGRIMEWINRLSRKS
jgi:cell division protein FtsA